MDPVEKEARSGLAGTAESKIVAPSQPDDESSPGWMTRAYNWLLLAGAFYVCFLLALLVPTIQRNAIFMHNVRFPLFANFSTPERYGLAPFRTRNLAIATPDGEVLGAWHTLPISTYRSKIGASYPPTTSLSTNVFDSALVERPTVLFFHGNAGNRALSLRTSFISSVSTALDVNAVIIDYRGFGDSTGSPSEAGLLADARAAWDWVLERNGGDPSKVAIAGQSLGTGVGSALVGQLAAEGVHPAILALLSPYSSMAEVVKTYSLFRVLPILKPLRSIPILQQIFTSPRFLKTRFDSLSTLSTLPADSQTTVLIAHALNDGEIPVEHADALFFGILETELGGGKPGVRSDKLSLEAITAFRTDWEVWRAKEDARISTVKVDGWGSLKTFKRAASGAEVVYLEAKYGGHDHLGGSEGVVALLGHLWGV